MGKVLSKAREFLAFLLRRYRATRNAFLFWRMKRLYQRAEKTNIYLKKIGYIAAFYYDPPHIDEAGDSPEEYEDERYWR